MTLEIGTQSNAPIDVGNIIFDEQYTVRWIDHTEPREEPKFDDPEKLQVRFRCEFEIINHTPEPGTDDPDLNGQRVADFFTVSLHEKANLGQAVRAMLGMKSDEAFANPRFDIDSLCASHNAAGNAGVCRVTIKRKENGYPKLVNFLPVRGAKNMNVAAGVPLAPVNENEPPF